MTADQKSELKFKRKTTWAIKTKLPRHKVHGSCSADALILRSNGQRCRSAGYHVRCRRGSARRYDCFDFLVSVHLSVQDVLFDGWRRLTCRISWSVYIDNCPSLSINCAVRLCRQQRCSIAQCGMRHQMCSQYYFSSVYSPNSFLYCRTVDSTLLWHATL